MAGEVASLLLSRRTVPVLFYLSERKKYPEPTVEPENPASEALDDAEAPAVESQESPVESEPVIGSVADSEPTTGNEQDQG
jgi:hypothetical protein